MRSCAYDDEDDSAGVPNQVQDDGEIDALDAYMMGIEEEQRKQDQQKQTKPQEEMFENEDPIEEQYEQFKKQLQEDEEARLFLDSDGDPDLSINTTKKKTQILVAPDHENINYRQIQRNFYEEHEEISRLSQQEVNLIRKEFQINIKGKEVPNPIVSFGHLNFDQALMDKISAQEFTKPTPIQSQALPVLLSGRNLIGIAKTGSGKTVAYVWPMLVHILDQPQVTVKQGPIAVVILPTRELGQQVFVETRKYCAPLNISLAAVLGGENKHYQWKELRQGVDIIIATPGRLIELIRKKATNMMRCTYVVVDEADSLFSLGFEQQIKSILDQIRPDRQISLFTATMKKKLKQLCVDQMQDPIVITIGSENNQVNEDIKQECVIIETEEDRLKWLLKNLNECLDRGKVLIFVSQIGQCEELAQELKMQMGVFALTMHGDKLQQERTQIINSFKAKSQLMIATDVASRGLDVKEIRTVINLYPPKNADIYIHRIGRTGRAGNHDGVAFTLLTNTDSWLAILLIKNLELAGQVVPQPLEDIAQLDSSFKMDRMKKKLGFDYAKGKDASRMLQQALKRQRNTRAGLGFDEQEPNHQKKVKINQTAPPPKPVLQLPVSFQPATAVSNQFKNRWGEINPYENLTSYAATVNKEVCERDEVIKIFQAKQRENFRAGFKSAGQAEPTTKKPTIKYIDNNK